MHLKNLIYAFAVTAFIFSCSNSSNDDVTYQDPDPMPDPDPSGEVTYQADIKPIIDNNCLSCHGNPPTNGAPISWTTYQNVSSNANSILNRISRQAGEAGAMPLGGPRLPQASIDLFQEWINDGLLEN